MRYLYALGVTCLLLLGWSPPVAAQSVPSVAHTHVVDLAGIIPPDEAQALRDKLKRLEARTTAQVVILTVKSLGRQSLFDLTHKTARAWKLGTAEKHNGVLIVYTVEPEGGRVGGLTTRIHVGKGLEGDLTDAESIRIIKELMLPHFSKKEYGKGFDKAVDRLDAIISGDEPSAEKTASRQQNEREFAALGFAVFLFLLATIALAIANAYHFLLGGAVGGSTFAGVGLLLAFTNPAVIAAGIIGLILGLMFRVIWDSPWCFSGCGDVAGTVVSGAGEFLGGGASG